MSITYLKMDFVGEQGVTPRLGRMVSTDNFATITTANYLTAYANGLNIAFEPTDMIAATYSDGRGWFNVNISGDIITLVAESSSGDVTVDIPTTVDNITFWADTAGKLSNTGYEPSSVAGDWVAMVSGSTLAGKLARYLDTQGTLEATNVQPSSYDIPALASVDAPVTINHIPRFSDTEGSIEDGYAVSDSGLTVVAGVNGATVVGHAAEFDDITGSIIDSGQRIPFSTDVSGAGGGITNPVTVTGAAIGDTAIFTGLTNTNNVACVLCSVTAPDEVTIVFTADPGAFTGKVLIQKAP